MFKNIINDYNPPKIPKEKVVMKYTDKNELEGYHYQWSPHRQKNKIEWEFEQLKNIQQQITTFNVERVITVIKILDEMSFDRLSNTSFIGWLRPFGMIEPNGIHYHYKFTDELSFLSVFSPNLINENNLQIVSNRELSLRRNIEKLRLKPNKDTFMEVEFWDFICKNTKPKFRYSLVKPHMIESLIISYELSNFYLTILRKGKGGDTTTIDKEEFMRLENVSTILGMMDVFGDFKLSWKPNKYDDSIYRKLNQTDLDLIKTHKNKFDELVTQFGGSTNIDSDQRPINDNK